MLPEQMREVLLRLAKSGSQQQRHEFTETQLRRAYAEPQRDWDAMSADERQAFIDDLVHEDRQYAP